MVRELWKQVGNNEQVLSSRWLKFENVTLILGQILKNDSQFRSKFEYDFNSRSNDEIWLQFEVKIKTWLLFKLKYLNMTPIQGQNLKFDLIRGQILRNDPPHLRWTFQYNDSPLFKEGYKKCMSSAN